MRLFHGSLLYVAGWPKRLYLLCLYLLCVFDHRLTAVSLTPPYGERVGIHYWQGIFLDGKNVYFIFRSIFYG